MNKNISTPRTNKAKFAEYDKWLGGSRDLVEASTCADIERHLIVLLRAATYVRDDLNLRSDIGTFDGDHSVQLGNGAWMQLNEAIDAVNTAYAPFFKDHPLPTKKEAKS